MLFKIQKALSTVHLFLSDLSDMQDDDDEDVISLGATPTPEPEEAPRTAESLQLDDPADPSQATQNDQPQREPDNAAQVMPNENVEQAEKPLESRLQDMSIDHLSIPRLDRILTGRSTEATLFAESVSFDSFAANSANALNSFGIPASHSTKSADI